MDLKIKELPNAVLSEMLDYLDTNTTEKAAFCEKWDEKVWILI